MTTIYQMYAANHIEIDGEGHDLACTVPSERNINNRFTVRCIEHDHSVEVVSCNCPGHNRWGHCKHVEIVRSFWARIYKSNQEKIAAKVEEEVKAEAEAAIAEAEKIVTTKSDVSATVTVNNASAETTDIGLKGNLTSKAFSILRR